MNWPRRSPSRDPHRRRNSGDAGDTLIEILVAVAIIGISATGIIGGLAAALGSSGTHRSLSTLDSIVRSFAETARYDIQLQSANVGKPQFEPSASAASYYQIASIPYPSSGPVGTAVTVFGSGFAPLGGNLTLVLTSTTNPTAHTPVVATGTVGANGSLTTTFIVPALPTGSYTIGIPDSSSLTPTGFLNAAAPFTVTNGLNPVSVSPVALYQVGLSDLQYWNGYTFAAQCTTASPYDQLQQLTISASAPGANDQLNFVVADPNYVFPAPVVTTVIGQVGATAAGFLQSGAPFYIYADATSPDGQPGVDPTVPPSEVTASFLNGLTTSGPQTVTLSSAGPGTCSTPPCSFPPAPDGHTYQYRSPQLTAASRTNGVSVHFTVNAVDEDHVPSEYSDNGTVTFDNADPTGNITITNTAQPNGYVTTGPIVVSLANVSDAESGLDTADGKLNRLSFPLTNGSCGTSPTSQLVATGAYPTFDDSTAPSGFCYEYQYVVADNVGNQGPPDTFTSNQIKYVTQGPQPPGFTFTNGSNVSANQTTLQVVFGQSAPSGGNFTVTVSDSDPSGISTFRFSPAPRGWSVTGTGTQPRTYTFTSGAAGGQIRVTATNGAGFPSSSSTFTLVPDSAGPSGGSVSVATPPNANGYTPASLTLTLSTGSDPYGINTSVSVLERLFYPSTMSGDGSCQATPSGTPLQIGATGVTGTQSDTIPQSGCYVYQYVVYNNLGNPTTYASTEITVDITNPSAAITYPLNGMTYTVAPGQSNTWQGKITGTATDPESGIAGVTVSIEDTSAVKWWDGAGFNSPSPVPLPATGTASWTYLFPATNLTDGDSYQIIATATNSAGLTGQSPPPFQFTG